MIRSSVRLASFVAVLALGLLPASAQADHVQCGDVITQDTTLDSDLLDCPGNGLVIGAGGITLDLNGHTIDGEGSGNGSVGIEDSAGYDGLIVEGGTIRDFYIGARLEGADGNRLTNLLIASTEVGVRLENGDANAIERNTFSGLGYGIGVFVYLSSTDNVIQGNSISGSATALVLWGGGAPDGVLRTRVQSNTLAGNGAGILNFLGAYYTLIRRNQVTDNFDRGITTAGDFALIDNNTISGNGFGIYVSGPYTHAVANRVNGNDSDGIRMGSGNTSYGTLLEHNTASGNGDDGIDIDTTYAEITRNTANDNGDLGIEAVPGVSDGGGNKARGNGNPLQCLNVFCR